MPYEIPFTFLGHQDLKSDNWNRNFISLEGEFAIDRLAFGVGSSNPALGDEVKVKFSTELDRKG